MSYIIFAVFLFAASVMTHIFFCRKAVAEGLQAKAFIIISIVALFIYMTGVVAVQYMALLDPSSLWGEPFRISAGIIFVLFVPIYLCFYVLTQLTSPSKKILSVILQAGELTYVDILTAVQNEDFIMTRLNDLCTSGCVKLINGRYVLTSEGQKIAAILNVMQWVLGRNAGG